MLSLRYFLRTRAPQASISAQIFKACVSTSSAQYNDHKKPDSSSSSSSSSSDSDSSSDSSDDEGKPQKTVCPKKDDIKLDSSNNDDPKKAQALNKLNTLLATMVGEEYVSSSTKALNAQMARPKRQLKQDVKEDEKVKEPEPIVTAAKKVAESLGGDVKQTESELLTKLRLHSTESESKKSTMNLNELIVGMKIDRERRPTAPEGRASQVRRILDNRRGSGERDGRERDVRGRGEEEWERDDRRGMDNERGRRREDRRPDDRRQQHPPMRVNLFGNEMLGIFSAKEHTAGDVATPPVMATWQALHERELRLAVTHPPANIFEEMILWTDQGKLWKFPIDNEQGLSEEQQVYFAEHVFLEPHLEPWCPRRGPVRHFMELVCVGLSKNPYLNVREKREHIEWFRDYFAEKRDILEETGALEAAAPTPQIET